MSRKEEYKSIIKLFGFDVKSSLEKEGLDEELKKPVDIYDKSLGLDNIEIPNGIWIPLEGKYCFFNIYGPICPRDAIETGLKLTHIDQVENRQLFITRTIFIISKIYHITVCFNLLHGNYNKLTKQQDEYSKYEKTINAESEIKTVTFSTSGSKIKMTSKEDVDSFKAILDKSFNRKFAINNSILSNLPSDYFKEEGTLNDAKVNKHFRQMLAREMTYYLKFLDCPKTRQHQFLGFLFMLAQLSEKTDDYHSQEYLQYLRDQGRNILNSI